MTLLYCESNHVNGHTSGIIEGIIESELKDWKSDDAQVDEYQRLYEHLRALETGYLRDSNAIPQTEG